MSLGWNLMGRGLSERRVAYRLGELPTHEKSWREGEANLPSVHLSFSAARSVRLPCGTPFLEASHKQILAFFYQLIIDAGERPRLSRQPNHALSWWSEIRAGLSFEVGDDHARWYMLQALLEIPTIRAVYQGGRRREEIRVRDENELRTLVGSYGARMEVKTSRGARYFHAIIVHGGRRHDVYVCSALMLSAGQVTREGCTAKLEAAGLFPRISQSGNAEMAVEVVVEPEETPASLPLRTIDDVKQFLRPYGLYCTIKRPHGYPYLYACRTLKGILSEIYLAPLSSLLEGNLTIDAVAQKLSAKLPASPTLKNAKNEQQKY